MVIKLNSNHSNILVKESRISGCHVRNHQQLLQWCGVRKNEDYKLCCCCLESQYLTDVDQEKYKFCCRWRSSENKYLLQNRKETFCEQLHRLFFNNTKPAALANKLCPSQSSTHEYVRQHEGKVDQVKDTRLIYCHFTTQGCKIRCRYSPVLLFQTNNYYLWWSWRMSGRHIWTPDLNMLTCCLFSCHKLTARCTLPRHGDARCRVFMTVTNKCW